MLGIDLPSCFNSSLFSYERELAESNKTSSGTVLGAFEKGAKLQILTFLKY